MISNHFTYLIIGWTVLAVLLFPIQLFITAPYGRHTTRSWGWLMDNRWGWTLMEIFSPLTFGYFFLSGPVVKTPPMWVFFALWMLHYLNRSLIFPWRTHTKGKQIPVAIVLSAMLFNVVNGFTNGYYLGYLSASYPTDWLGSWQFLVGGVLFISGALINLQSDRLLLNLRKPGERGYKIPYGGFFRYISCPNHFGEMIEWAGFAVMCWNLPALGFAIWTVANLLPRALSHHRWYRSHFAEYPAERKAVFPGLW